MKTRFNFQPPLVIEGEKKVQTKMSTPFFDSCSDTNGNVKDGMVSISSYIPNRINSDVINDSMSLLPPSSSSSTTTTLLNSSHQLYEQMNSMQNPMFESDPYLMAMNHKFSQFSISDMNSDERKPPSFSQILSTSSTNLKPDEQNAFLGMIDQNDDHAMLPNNNNNNNNIWSADLDLVLKNLSSKLNSIKQTINEFLANYRDAQNNYVQFMDNCRNHMNLILQEINMEMEQMFKNKMIELNSRMNQLEEAIYKIETRKQCSLNEKQTNNNNINNNNNNTFSPSKNSNSNHFHQNDDQESFIDAFDADYINFVKNMLNYNVPVVDFRMPDIDRSLIDRAFRCLLIPLIKQQPPTLDSSILGENPTTTALSPSFIVPTLSTVENDDNPNTGNQFMFNSYANWTNNNNNNNNLTQPAKHPVQNSIEPINDSLISMEYDRNAQDIYYSYSNDPTLPVNNYYGPQPFSNGGGLPPAQQTCPNELNQILNQKQAITKSLQPKVRRERISYYLKFGESGAMDGQFAEPSGVAVNPINDEIFIADANNHRVQVFDKWGKFKFHFGDGKLKFPNRVALSRNTGDIVVSERPPVHQIQVYNKNGMFVCKFGAKHLRHPRGLAVDHKNRVVVVECKVMRVFIFNLQGVLLHSFDCSEQIQFPNAVAVSKKEEIFISDNRNHCVKVFNFMGEFLRQIGGQGITNYPIGVCLNEQADQLLVVDNYNNLNVTVFRLDGQLIGAYESSAKHQQCLDVALFGDHSIVVTSKDLHVYFYRLKDYINNSHQRRMQNANSGHLQSLQNNNNHKNASRTN